MATIKEQIEMIRAEIDKTQKNKATNAHIGKLKAKIAQLKLKEEKAAAHSKASGGGKGFEVRQILARMQRTGLCRRRLHTKWLDDS